MDEILEQIEREEMRLLKEFLHSLKEEKDAIISFSIEGLLRQKEKKEKIVERLSFLEEEKRKILKERGNADRPFRKEIERLGREVLFSLEKNRDLLSFSMEHIGRSIERLLNLIRDNGYGKIKKPLSLILSKEV